MIAFLTSPTVTLLGAMRFVEPAHLPVRWGENVVPPTDGERLIEFAGRLCYMSQGNPADRTTPEYIDNILAQGHGSVLEHATVSLLLEGVSRSLTHELVRHRAGFAYSQLSQRYVGSEHVAFVVPPALLDRAQARAEFEQQCHDALLSYQRLCAFLEGDGLPRKQAREAARGVLGNATETKIVVTGNGRSWRHLLAMRGSPAADAEIQRLVRAIYPVLQTVLPSVFDDFTLGDEGLVPRYAKV